MCVCVVCGVCVSIHTEGSFFTKDENQYITVTKCTHNTKRGFLQLFPKILLMIIRSTQ